MKFLKIAGIFFLTVIVLSWATFFVIALPTGPSSAITPLSSSRYSEASAKTADAIAGNVSEINLNANAITQTWQGYFGNITGNILLGNSNNNTLYNWALASPQGEVYATSVASVPAWANVRCANVTEIAAEDASLGVNQSRDADSVNNTFSIQSHVGFYVGSVNLANDTCYSTYLYNFSGAQSNYWSEILLSDDASVPLIYTALLEDNIFGFDNRTHDFQMIVGENGHNGNTATTTYYFYLELE